MEFDRCDGDTLLVANNTPLPGRLTVEPGSLLARLVYGVWSGSRVTVVNSPPGAGKTAMVASLIAFLAYHSNLSIQAVTFTRKAASELAGRIAQTIAEMHDPDDKYRPKPVVVFKLKAGEEVIPGVVSAQPRDCASFVTVRTTASCVAETVLPQCDIMVIDEAYQLTYAAVEAAADGAAQLVLVGDPGQIGPVVTANTEPWSNSTLKPHSRAPEVYEQQPGCVVENLRASYRLGPRTVEAISPLYDFTFVSRRPERALLLDGELQPEITAAVVPFTDTPSDLVHMHVVADLVSKVLTGSVMTEEGEFPLTDNDVCVVVSHNVQVTGIRAILAERGHRVTVGTADRLQGSQWHVVVAVDALVGHEFAGGHQVSVGRMGVMASRHMTHLIWVHEKKWRKRLLGSGESPAEIALGIEVRSRLLAEQPKAVD